MVLIVIHMELNVVYNEDCIEGMNRIEDKSVDMILCDLPYGTTACKWDIIIPFDKLWKQYKRIIKDNGAVVLTCREPFTSIMISSNLKEYKHKWVWNKKQSGSFQNAKYMPLQIDEDIIVFCNGKVNYYPIMRQGKMRKRGGAKEKSRVVGSGLKDGYENYSDLYYPTNIIELVNPRINKLHPTQKPIELFEYLIETYTNENEIVLDNCMGSGTTAIACINTNRNYIGFELDKGYYDIILERIKNHKSTIIQDSSPGLESWF
jgi:site-specific DNA-methyltransferase (adenine-specific)